jgi:hypothetical protein
MRYHGSTALNLAAGNCRGPVRAQEKIMSQRNGDKARFGKDRKRKIAQRKRGRDLRQQLSNKTLKPAAPSTDK